MIKNWNTILAFPKQFHKRIIPVKFQQSYRQNIIRLGKHSMYRPVIN